MAPLTPKSYLLLLAALLLASAPCLNAQDPEAAANSHKARATLDAMVAALGGERWLNLVSEMEQGRSAGFYQGKPTGSDVDFYEIQKFPDQTRIELGKKRDVFEIISGKQAWEITYRGKRELPQDQVQEILRRRDHSIPVAIRIWLKNPSTVLIYDGQNLVERHLADQTTLIDAQNDSITIETDAETHLPLRRTWQWRDPVYHDKNTDAEEYDNYEIVEGFPTPFDITRFHNGDMTNQRYVNRAAYNVSIPPDAFDPDAAAAKIKK